MWHQWFNLKSMKLWEYFLCAKKTKITTSIQQFLLFHVSLRHTFTRLPQSMDAMLLMQEPVLRCRTQMCCDLFRSRGRLTYALWFSRERASQTDTAEKNLSIKNIFTHKKYSYSFIKLRMNHWCHIWVLNVSVALLSMEGQKALGFQQK